VSVLASPPSCFAFPAQLCESLLMECLRLGSRDNMSVIIVAFRAADKPSECVSLLLRCSALTPSCVLYIAPVVERGAVASCAACVFVGVRADVCMCLSVRLCGCGCGCGCLRVTCPAVVVLGPRHRTKIAEWRERRAKEEADKAAAAAAAPAPGKGL
jgi:hypothetical protein